MFTLVNQNLTYLTELELKVSVLQYMLDNPPAEGKTKNVINPCLIGCDLPLIRSRVVLDKLHTDKLAVILNYPSIGSTYIGVLQDYNNVIVLGSITDKGAEWLEDYFLKKENSRSINILTSNPSPNPSKILGKDIITWILSILAIIISVIIFLFQR